MEGFGVTNTDNLISQLPREQIRDKKHCEENSISNSRHNQSRDTFSISQQTDIKLLRFLREKNTPQINLV